MDYLILVNRFEPLPDDYGERLSLRKIQGKFFEKQTAQMLEAMINDAMAEGVMIRVISGYRSDDHQQMLREREISKNMGCGLSYEAAVRKTDRTLAPVGCSEHATGLAADLGTWDADDVQPYLHKTPEGKWLCRKAASYGFILRYPLFKEHITGIDHEPWHYRYVGPADAKRITESGICLEEFLHFYSDKYTQC